MNNDKKIAICCAPAHEWAAFAVVEGLHLVHGRDDEVGVDANGLSAIVGAMNLKLFQLQSLTGDFEE